MLENIDGYVTKDDLYRMISRFRGSLLTQKQTQQLCNAIKDVPNRLPTDRTGRIIPEAVEIKGKRVLAGAFIQEQDKLLDMMSEMLMQLTEFFSIPDVLTRLNWPDCLYRETVQRMVDTSDILLDAYKEKRL